MSRSRSSSRSTICAWSVMFVSDWAGPSCIDRAISRRRSSWALRTTRDSDGGSVSVDSGRATADWRRAAGPSPATISSVSRSMAPSALATAATASRWRLQRPALAVEVVDLRLHEDGAAGEGHELRVRLGVARRRCPRSARRPGPASARGGSPRCAPGRRACRSRRARDRARRRRPRGARRAHRPWRAADSRAWSWQARLPGRSRLSPPASGSSPGASHTRRPGSGRSRTACAGSSSCGS